MINLRRLIRDEDGPAAVEYAVMMAMILGVCFAGLASFGGQLGGSFDNSAETANDAMSDALSNLD